MKTYYFSLYCMLSTLLWSTSCQTSKNRNRKNSVATNIVTETGHESSLLDSAHFFFDNGNNIQAIKYYTLLIKEDTMQGAYYYERGTCKLDEFDSLGALSDFRKATFLNYPKKKYLYLNMAALFLLDFRNYDSAIFYYNATLKEDPNNEKAIKGRAAAVELEDMKKH